MAPPKGKIKASNPPAETVRVTSRGGSLSVELASYTPPVVANPQGTHRAGIAPFGLDNRYPEHSLQQFKGSPTHGAICRSTANLYSGLGFEFTGTIPTEEWIKSLGEGRSINRMGKQWALDLKIHNGYAVQVMWAQDGKSIARLKYVDFSHVRKNLDQDEKLIDYRLHKRWGPNVTLTAKGMLTLPPFDPSKVTAKVVNAKGEEEDAIDAKTLLPIIVQPNQLYYYEAASPGQINYPEPDYIAADTDIKIDRLFKGFHANNILNGLTPSMVIVINGPEPDPDQKNDLRQNVSKTFKGEKGSKVLLLWNDGDQEVKVTPLDVKNNESRYLEIAKYVKGEIISAHMLPSGRLAGLSESGGIGSNGLEIKTAFQLFNFTVIANGQDNLIEGLQHIFDAAEMDVQVAIIPLDPFADLVTNEAPPTAAEAQ